MVCVGGGGGDGRKLEGGDKSTMETFWKLCFMVVIGRRGSNHSYLKVDISICLAVGAAFVEEVQILDKQAEEGDHHLYTHNNHDNITCQVNPKINALVFFPDNLLPHVVCYITTTCHLFYLRNCTRVWKSVYWWTFCQGTLWHTNKLNLISGQANISEVPTFTGFFHASIQSFWVTSATKTFMSRGQLHVLCHFCDKRQGLEIHASGGKKCVGMSPNELKCNGELAATYPFTVVRGALCPPHCCLETGPVAAEVAGGVHLVLQDLKLGCVHLGPLQKQHKVTPVSLHFI